jgi:putative transposase
MMVGEKKQILQRIDEAHQCGSRLENACEIVGISSRTHQRWKGRNTLTDKRTTVIKTPHNRLSEFETKQIIKVANEPEFAHLSPAKIVPKLADQQRYIASESSFYRVLKQAGQTTHRQNSKPKTKINKPRALIATEPNQVYSWDISYLKSQVKGLYFYLYLMLDIYSRKIVGFQVHHEESADHAAQLLKHVCLQEKVTKDKVTLHSDNGGPMKGATMIAMLEALGVMPSFSRPAVSNDNPYSESLFRTLKYCPKYPSKGFASILEARTWTMSFINWYNTEHMHSSIGFVTPEQRHTGEDKAILENRKKVYQKAKDKHPERWSAEIRNWDYIDTVNLNPDNQMKIQVA